MKRLFVLAAGLLALALSPASAQERLSPPHISISGEATMTAPPDTARLRAGVSTTGATARDASAANRKLMAAVVAAAKAGGIAEKDIQTSRYAIQPVYDNRSNSSSQPKITGYMATNNVVLTLRKLDEIGDLIDKLTDAGANSFGGVEFIVSDAGKLLDKVRADALADARRKAQIYADAAGVKLGSLLSLSENINMPRPVMYMARAAAAPAPETSISAGENTLQVSVSATFELVKP